MWNNFLNHPVNLSALNDIPFTSTNYSEGKKTCKQVKFERELNFETDTDFQTFLLPLEQDFTKSSKGYASVFASTADNKFNSVDCKNESRRTKNIILPDFPDTDYFRNSSSNNLSHDDSLSSNEHHYASNGNNLYYQKCEKLIYDTVENFEDAQTCKNILKNRTKVIHCTQQCSHNEDNISEKQDSISLEKCIETINGFSAPLSYAARLSNESESSEVAIFLNKSRNFSNDSSCDDSTIFCEKDAVNKFWCSSTKNKQSNVKGIDSETCDNSYLKKSEKNAATLFSEDFAIDLKKSLAVEKDICDSVITVQTEGYVNAAFEDYDSLSEESSFLKSINDSWNDSMKDISGEPHKSKKVSFVPLSDLVSVLSYEPDDDDYCYSLYVLDQLRFQDRIKEFEHIIAPYLTPKHRANIYRKNCPQD